MDRGAQAQGGIAREESGESPFTGGLYRPGRAAQLRLSTKDTGSPWPRKLGRTQPVLLVGRVGHGCWDPWGKVTDV